MIMHLTQFEFTGVFSVVRALTCGIIFLVAWNVSGAEWLKSKLNLGETSHDRIKLFVSFSIVLIFSSLGTRSYLNHKHESEILDMVEQNEDREKAGLVRIQGFRDKLADARDARPIEVTITEPEPSPAPPGFKIRAEAESWNR